MMRRKEIDSDLLENLATLLNYIQNVKIEAFNEGVDEERERCASIAEHLNGWGKKPNHELANHIAATIRAQSRF
jgi:hypothetical protein